MSHSGGRRVRSLGRWFATPALLGAAALVVYANLSGGTTLLRTAGVVTLAVAIGAVVLFDSQLVRARRAHAADRAALAKSYAETYAAHIRVTNRPVVTGSVDSTADTASAAAGARVISDTPPPDAPDIWEAQEAPTVVDLLAWEERARVGIVDSPTWSRNANNGGQQASSARDDAESA